MWLNFVVPTCNYLFLFFLDILTVCIYIYTMYIYTIYAIPYHVVFLPQVWKDFFSKKSYQKSFPWGRFLGKNLRGGIHGGTNDQIRSK